MIASRIGNAARWAAGRGDELPGRRILAVSVHLDDAVLSVGAALARAARGGAEVTILTVLANDPVAEGPAGAWDAEAGFSTAREAATVRRDEDRRACALLGARPVWLPYGDSSHGLGAEDDEIAKAVEAHVEGMDTVLVPGSPLMHEDHGWLAGLLAGPLPAARIGRFVEQPYTALWTQGAHADDGWLPLAAGVRDRLAKVRASRSYRSQLPLLDRHAVYRTLRYEALHSGEAVAWTATERV